MIQRFNYDPGHDPTLNNDSDQDSEDNFPEWDTNNELNLPI